MSSFHRFARVASGLKLVYISLVILVLTVVGGGLAAGMMGARRGGQGGQAELGVLVLVLVGMGLLSAALSIYGQIQCLDVPDKVRATKSIYAAVILSVIGAALNIAGSFGLWTDQLGLSRLFTTAGWISFLIFLRRLAIFLNNARQAARANFVLYGSIGTWIGMVVLAILLLGSLRGGQNAAFAGALGLGTLVLLVFALVLFISYSNLIRELRIDIEDRLSGRSMEA